jgi:hypothetical protein
LHYAPKSPQLIRRTNSELKTPEKHVAFANHEGVVSDIGGNRYFTDCNQEFEVKDSNVYGFALNQHLYLVPEV